MQEKKRFLLECGRVKTKNNANFKHIEYEVDENGCWNCVSHSCYNNGYPRINLKGTKQTALSRFVYEFYKEKIKEGNIILHSCDNPKCINPNHLTQGTHMENMIDMVKKDRHLKGSKNAMSKLKEDEVLNIVKYSKDGLSKNSLSIMFNTSIRNIKSILKGERWNWLTNIKNENTSTQ